MIQTGKIIDVGERTATVEFSRGGMCGKCNVCSISGESDSVSIKIDNKINAAVGDRVDVELASKQLIKSSMITYLLPLVLAVVGLIAGMVIGGELLSFVMFVVFTALGFFAVKYCYPRLIKCYSRPRIKSIVESDEVSA